MTGGPSKQELEMYWQNSRQYFDELAKHYQTADPEYYKEYIKPFYDNPFRSVGQAQTGKSSGGSKAIVFAVFLLLFIGVLGAAIFIFFSSSDSITKKVEEITGEKEVTKDPIISEPDNTKNETTPEEELPEGELSGEDNYIIGAKYIAEKKYDKAAWHLKQIKKGDKRYKEAQQLLESIKYLKKYDK